MGELLDVLEAREIFFLFVLLIASFLDVVYFFPIIHTAFFKKPEGVAEEAEVKVKEAPLFMLVPLSITAIFSVIFFLDFILRLDIISMYFYKLVEIAVGNVVP